MAPMGRNYGRGGHRDHGSHGGKLDEDFSNDKPTDPPESEKLKLIEDSKTEFFKRRKIELTNLPNDPRPEVSPELFIVCDQLPIRLTVTWGHECNAKL